MMKMQTINVIISVEYRSDGKADKSRVVEAIADLIRKTEREILFVNNATYAGYTVSLENKKK